MFDINDYDFDIEKLYKINKEGTRISSEKKIKSFELKYNKETEIVYKEYKKGNTIIPEIDLYEWVFHYLILEGRDY